MLAILVKLGYPSGVETTLVPALITILWALAKSARPLITIGFMIV